MSHEPEEANREASLYVIESALKSALRDYSRLRRGEVPQTFELEAGTQSCEAALGSVERLKAMGSA